MTDIQSLQKYAFQPGTNKFIPGIDPRYKKEIVQTILGSAFKVLETNDKFSKVHDSQQGIVCLSLNNQQPIFYPELPELGEGMTGVYQVLGLPTFFISDSRGRKERIRHNLRLTHQFPTFNPIARRDILKHNRSTTITEQGFYDLSESELQKIKTLAEDY